MGEAGSVSGLDCGFHLAAREKNHYKNIIIALTWRVEKT